LKFKRDKPNVSGWHFYVYVNNIVEIGYYDVAYGTITKCDACERESFSTGEIKFWGDEIKMPEFNPEEN